MPLSFPSIRRVRLISFVPNLDGSPPSAYSIDGGFLDQMYAEMGLGVMMREDHAGPYDIGVDQVGQTADWTGFDTRMALPWFGEGNGRLIFQINADEVNPYTTAPITGDGDTTQDAQVWHATDKIANAKYRIGLLRDHFPNTRGVNGIALWLCIHEGDIDIESVCRLTNTGSLRKNTAIERHVALQKAIWEALKTEPDTPHSGVVGSVTVSLQGLQRTSSATTWRVGEILAYNNGEILNYMDAFCVTMHHAQSNFLHPGFTSSGLTNPEPSLYWAWLGMKDARLLNPTAKPRPIFCSDYGATSRSQEYGSQPSGEWLTETGKNILRAYRLGLAANAMFYWAIPLVSLYSVWGAPDHLGPGNEPDSAAGTAGTQNFVYWNGAIFSEYSPVFTTIKRVFDMRRYILPSTGTVSIVAKSGLYNAGNLESGFHLPYSWAVCASLYLPPTGTSINAAPTAQWNGLSIADNLITSVAGSERLVSRPVILPRFTRYRLQAEMQCTGGGVANINVRGFDQLDGTTFVRSANAPSSWGTVSVEFMPRGHEISSLPSVAFCCIIAYHNGTGTMSVRNVRIDPIQEDQPTLPDDYLACVSTTTNLFLNPGSALSALKRPIGSGATWHQSTHAMNVDWMKAAVADPTRPAVINMPSSGRSPGLWDCSNPADTFQTVVVFDTSGSGGNASQFPVTLRLPNGFGPSFNGAAGTDQLGLFYQSDGTIRDFYRLNQGTDGVFRAKDNYVHPATGTSNGGNPRGTSASGIWFEASIFRGHEWNTDDSRCEHALGVALGARLASHPYAQLGPSIVWPATSSNTGSSSNEGSIPYGQYFSIPSQERGGPNPNALGLGTANSVAWRLYWTLVRYGVVAMDQSTGVSFRADQDLLETVRSTLHDAFAILWPHCRAISNVGTSGSNPIGGGNPIAPNCAFDSTNRLIGPPPPPPVRAPSWWKARYSLASDLTFNQPRSTSGDSWDLYTLGLSVDGNTAMFRATGETVYLDRAILYTTNAIATAQPSSALTRSQYRNSATSNFLGWENRSHPGFGNNGLEYPLFEMYMWRHVCMMLYAMQDLPAYINTYNQILAFTEQNIWRKWYLRGPEGTLYREVMNIVAHTAIVAIVLKDISTDPTIRSQAATVLANIDNAGMSQYQGASVFYHLRAHPNDAAAYYWPAYWPSQNQSEPYGSDSSHASAVAKYIAEAYDRGYGFWARSDINKLIRLFSSVIWPSATTHYYWLIGASGQDPQLWDGNYSDGFVCLGRYDRALQTRLESHTVAEGAQLFGNGALNARILGEPYYPGTSVYCRSPVNDFYLNPCSASSPFKQPIAADAAWEADSHPSTVSLRLWNSGIGVNNGNTYGENIAQIRTTDPLQTITWDGTPYGGQNQFPVTIRIPTGFQGGGGEDGCASLYDPVQEMWHAFYRLIRTTSGTYRAALHYLFDPRGTGLPPGYKSPSASGLSMTPTLLRAHECNPDSGDVIIEHALNLLLGSRSADPVRQLSRFAVWPAAYTDGWGATNIGGVDYGELVSIKPQSKGGPNPNNLNLGASGSRRWRIYNAIRDYGMYVYDTAPGPKVRADGQLTNAARIDIEAALTAIYPHLYAVRNNVSTTQYRGGNTAPAAALNCAFNSTRRSV